MDAKATKPLPIPAELQALVTLAQLLQRLEASAVPVAPQQYRSVVQRLERELRNAPPGAVLEAVLSALPAAAELYENLHYEHAGLCRSPLEPALNAELSARQALQRAAR